MGILDSFFGGSPFGSLLQHTKKVHECVETVSTITARLVAGEFGELNALHHACSTAEHEADKIKDEIRLQLKRIHLMSVGRFELMRFLSFQDDVADAAEDYAVLARIRPTQPPEPIREDFLALANQVVRVSEQLLALAEEISVLAGSAFTGKEAEKVLGGIQQIGEEEWKADKLARHFAEKMYQNEKTMDPITILFLDKYCVALGKIANAAEKAAKYLRQIIGS